MTLGADLKEVFFPVANTAHKCSYFKIFVSVKIRSLYESLFLKFWKLESFSEARLSLEYTNQFFFGIFYFQIVAYFTGL